MSIKSGTVVGITSKNPSRYNAGTVIGVSHKSGDVVGTTVKNTSRFNTGAVVGVSRKSSDVVETTSKNTSSFNTGTVVGVSRGRKFEYDELVLTSLNADLISMSKTLQEIYSGWQNKEKMKEVKVSVESIYNRLIKFQDYRKQYGITEGDDKVNDLVTSYKSILDGWDNLSMEYGQYKSADAYKKAMEDAKAYAEQTEKAKTDDLTLVQKEVDDLKEKLKNADSIHSKISYGATTRANAQEMVTKNKQAEKELQDLVSSYGYNSYEDLKKAVGERESYLNRAKVIQGNIQLTNDALNSADFDAYAQKGEKEYGYETTTLFNKEYNAVADFRNYPDKIESLKDTYEDQGALVSSTMKQADGWTKILLARHGTDEEYKTYNYWYAKDRENGTENADKYLKSLADELNKREGQAVTEEYKDKNALSKILYGIPAGLDQFVSGVSNALNFTDDYLPTTSTQYASQGIRRQLYDTGFDLPEWLGGSSLGQVTYDAVNTTANMVPSIAAGTVADALVPGAGTYVTAGLMGLSASGNAYQQMLNQGYNKTQSRTYATLVGVSEASLSAALSGMIGGKATEKAIETAIKGIDNGFLRFAVRWGVSGLSEIPEESLQAILEPMFQNIAVGYDLNNMSELDWSQIAYDGLLGGISGLGIGGVTSAASTGVEQHTWNKAGKNARANNTTPNVLDIVQLTPQESDAYATYTRYANKGINAENITDTQIGRLYDESNTYAKSVLNSKKSTVSAKENATKILNELSKADEKSTVDKDTIARVERGVVYESALHENVDALIESGLESAENTKSHKLAVELQNKINSGKEITTQEIVKLQEANEKAFGNEITSAMPENEAKLLYGGEISIDDISEELNVEPKKIEILIRREGLGTSHVEENRTAVMTQERIERGIKENSAKFHPDYASRYITRISPKDFIDLTVSQKNIDREKFDSNVEGDSGSIMSDFDYASALRNSEQSPYLSIDRSTGQVIGHNGRHRIKALEMAGIESVEIEVELHDEDGRIIKYNSETIPDMAISSQFDTAIETHLANVIPFNEAHRDEIEKTYGEKAHSNVGVKYADRDFAQQVDAVLNGEDTTSTHLRISEHTPKILMDIGLSDKPLLITSAHTKTALGYNVKGKNIHNVSKDVFVNLPQLIEKPAIVMESTKQGSIVMFVNAVDVDNNPVVCAIKIDGKGYYNNVELESNIVTSVYGKDTNPVGFIEKAVDENRLLYWDKKMSQELFDIPGLQLSDNINNFDSNVIIRKINENVKENTVKNSDRDTLGNTLSKGQQSFFADSKVRDENGNLMVMYHGSPKTDISSFRLNLGGAYFTSDSEYAKAYARGTGKVYEVYLNITKPFDTRNTKDRDIFDKEFYGQWGNGAPLSEKGLPDWTDGDDLIDFLQEKGYDYDGLILDEGGVPTESGVKDRGISYVVFDKANQVKYTDNLNPTTNEEFKDLILNGVVDKDGKVYGGLKQQQGTSNKLDAEAQQIIDEYRERLKEKYSKDVLGKKFSDRETLNDAAEKLATISDKEYLKAKEEFPFVYVMDNTPSIVLNTMFDDNKNSLANDRPILIRRDALYLAIRESGIQEGHYHGLGAEAIKKLPEYLEKPDVILKTNSRDDKRLVLSHIEAKNGQAIISVEFETIKTFEGKKDYYNIIVTVFDLHKNYLNSLFKKHNAEIKYEKEDLEQSNPQLYEWLRIINSKSSKDSLLQDNGKSQEKLSDRDNVFVYDRMGATKKHINELYENKYHANAIPLNEVHGEEIARNYGEKAHTSIGVKYALGRFDESTPRKNEREVQGTISQGNYTGGMVGGITTDDFFNTNISNQKADSLDESAFLIPISKQQCEYIQKICDKLDVDVVFEDLREMVYKGKIISADGYVLNGVIHLNLYAKNPIGFVLKHELTHYSEKASRYSEFVNAVKTSHLYKKWICEKMSEKNTRIAEYKYKQKVLATHLDINSINDFKIETEMIADFVGEMLFTDNGSGMVALTVELDTKKRNAVVKWIIDFISYLKKKLSGQKYMTFELSVLEDGLRRLIFEVSQEYANVKTENTTELNNTVSDRNRETSKHDESDISFCFVHCDDEELVREANRMEKLGADGVDIYKQIGVFKNVFGDWVTYIDLDNYRFYAFGNSGTKYKLIQKKGQIVGTLRDIVIWPELYEKFPDFEKVKVVIKYSKTSYDKMKFIPGENGGTIFINQKLCDDYIAKENVDAKIEMVKTIQHMIQFKEGNYIGKNYDYWKELETKGKLPYSKTKGRYLTADDMMRCFIDNYDAEMASRRQFVKYVVTNLDKKPNDYRKSFLYQPYIDTDDVIVYGKNNKLMSLSEKNGKKLKDSKDDYLKQKKIEQEIEKSAVNEIGEATQKVKDFVWTKEKKPSPDFRQRWSQINGGNSGFLEKSEINAEKRFENQYIIKSKTSIADVDTIGRSLLYKIGEQLYESIAINHKGQPISLYALSLKDDKTHFGVALGTIDSVIEKYNDINLENISSKKISCLEFYAIVKKPFEIVGDLSDLSIDEIVWQYVEAGYLSEKKYLKWKDTASSEENLDYNNYMTKKLKKHMIKEGFDSIIYENQKYDKGSMTLVAFNESQLIPVAKDGILIEDNGIENVAYENYKFDENLRADGVEENNEKLAMYVEEPKYNLRTVRKQVDSRLKMGDAGCFEEVHSSSKEAYEYLYDKLGSNMNKELSGYDTAGRRFKDRVLKEFDKCIFREEKGDILTFCLWNTKPKNISLAVKMGIEFGSVDCAFKKFFNHKESKVKCYNGVFEEFILNCCAPIILPFDSWDAQKVAKYLLDERKITPSYYKKLNSLRSISSPTYISDAAQKLREEIKRMGYDCIVFAKSSGEKTVVTLYDELLIPISQNGILNQECKLYDDAEYKENNDSKAAGIIEQKSRPNRDFSKVKDIILSETSATKKLRHLTEFLSYASNSILEENDKINIGFSGVFENIGQNVWKFVSVCKKLISETARAVEINQYDTADRYVEDEIRQRTADTIFKDEDGKLLSFFFWNKYGDRRFKHSAWGYNVTTLEGAHNAYLAERQKYPQLKTGEYEEYYVNASKPYILQNAPKEITAKKLAEELYKNGVLSGNEYRVIRSIVNSDETNHLSGAMRCLNSILVKKGYDCIIYINGSQDIGGMGIIVFDQSQLIPVSVNGQKIENNTFEISDSNGSDLFVDENNVEKNKNNLLDYAEDKEYNKIEKVKCINKELAGKKHAVTGVPFERVQTYVVEKIIEVVVPRFDSFFDAQLPEELYTIPNKRQFKECYRQLREALKDNAGLRELFTEQQLKALENGKELNGYTWHHDVVVGRMQLVDTHIHRKTGHTGGQYFWGGGTKNR